MKPRLLRASPNIVTLRVDKNHGSNFSQNHYGVLVRPVIYNAVLLSALELENWACLSF